jgi:hypothetical protein
MMAIQVAEAPLMPTLDYWAILGRALNNDGSLYERGLLTFQNGHPTFLPALVYYLNAAYLGGTNTALGVLALLLALTTVLLLVRSLPVADLGRGRAAVAVVAIAWLIFTPKGLHSFVNGFSGVAWMSANLLVVAALLLTVKGRFWWALVPTLTACACYGTSFALWPALLVAQRLRGSNWRVQATTALLGVVVGSLWLLARPTVPPRGADGDWPSYVQAWAAVMGGLWTSSSIDLATVMGLLVAGAAAVVTFRALAPHFGGGGGRPIGAPGAHVDTGPAPIRPAVVLWLSLLVWGVLAGGLIAVSRAETAAAVGLESRYASVPALTICAVLVLGLLTAPPVRLSLIMVPTTLLILLMTAGSTGSYRTIHESYSVIELSGIAARIGETENLTRGVIWTDRLPAAEKLGTYPFNSLFGRDCDGLLPGDRIDRSGLPQLAPPRPGGPSDSPAPSMAAVEQRVTEPGVRLEGWALVEGQQADCILLAHDEQIIGAGLTGLPRPDVGESTGTLLQQLGWRAFAPPGYRPDDVDVIVVLDGARYLLPAPGGD